MKLLLELGPLVLFFVVNKTNGILWATGLFVVAVLISLAISWQLYRKLSPILLIGGAFVLVFGGLTVALEDQTFIQLKPTVASLFFAVAILVGLMRDKLVLRMLLGEALALTDEGWLILSRRWALFFIALAATNEVVRLTQDLDTWVAFKVWGILPLSLVFTFSQLGVMQRHELKAEADGEDSDG